MQTGVSLLILDVMAIYMTIALDIVIIIWSSINCPTVICLLTVCYFSREKPLVKPTAPGSSFSYICLRDLHLFAFIFRSFNPKNQKYFAALYFICDLFIKSITTFSRHAPIFGTVTRKGLTTPLTRRVVRCCYLCVGVVYVVLLGSPTGSITLVSSLRKIPTAAVLHHPFLFREIPT